MGFGRGGSGQQSHDRQVGVFQGAAQDWRSAYPVGPGSEFSRLDGWGQQFQGVPRQRARLYERPWKGVMEVGMGVGHHGRGVQRGPYFSGVPCSGPNHGNRGGSGGALQSGVPFVVPGRGGTVAAPGPAGGSRVVTSTSSAASYAGAVVGSRRTVGSRGVAGRGSAATGHTGAPGRGVGWGVTIAKAPAQLARAAAQRDAREAGQGRATAVGGSPRWSGRSGSKMNASSLGAE